MLLRRPVLHQCRFLISMQLAADGHHSPLHVDNAFHHITELCLGKCRKARAADRTANNLDRHRPNSPWWSAKQQLTRSDPWCQRGAASRYSDRLLVGYNHTVKTRRLGGLVVGALMLHLGFVAQAAQCLAPSLAPHSHHPSGSHQSSAPEQQHHKTPSLPVCCQALTSCSPTVVLGRDALALTSIAVSARRVISPLDSTTSRTAAPEAPPPRV